MLQNLSLDDSVTIAGDFLCMFGFFAFFKALSFVCLKYLNKEKR